MRKIFWKGMMPMMFWMILACKKEKEIDDRSSAQLLTGKEWILFSIGFDNNSNGVLDNNEELIKDCEKDNTILFTSDGQGFFQDKGVKCDGPIENNFSWVFINNSTSIEIEGNVVSIVKLDENELIYTPKLDGVNPKLIIHYRH